MAFLVFLMLSVFVGLLGWGRGQIARHLGDEVASGAVALVLATVLGMMLVLITYAETFG